VHWVTGLGAPPFPPLPTWSLLSFTVHLLKSFRTRRDKLQHDAMQKEDCICIKQDISVAVDGVTVGGSRG